MEFFAAAALVLALGSVPARAAGAPTAPAARAALGPKDALLGDMDEMRALWLPVKTPVDPLTERFGPSLADLRRAAEAAEPGEALEKSRRAFHDWKDQLYRAKFAADGGSRSTKLSYQAYANELTRQESFAAAARRDVRLQAAQNRVFVQQLTWQSQGTGDGKRFFDAGRNAEPSAPRGFVVAAVVPHYRTTPAPKPVSPDDAAAPPAPGDSATSPTMFSRFIQNVSSLASGASTTISNAIFNYAAGVQKFLTAGLIQAESGFRTVGSWAGCYGIAQFSEAAARMYHVLRGDSVSSVKGAVAYQRDLQAHFAKPGDAAKLQALFVEAAARYDAALASAGPNPSGQAKQKALDASFHQIYGRIPYGIENAIAGYNAGQGAVDGAGGWTHLPLPRGGCVNRPPQDNSYCQTMAYVPRVLENSFGVYVNTRQRPAEVQLASN